MIPSTRPSLFKAMNSAAVSKSRHKTDVLLDGGSGNDIINATANVAGFTVANVTLNTNVFGGDGNDTINATIQWSSRFRPRNDLTNTVDGGAGNDHITAYAVSEFHWWAFVLLPTNSLVAAVTTS